MFWWEVLEDRTFNESSFKVSVLFEMYAIVQCTMYESFSMFGSLLNIQGFCSMSGPCSTVGSFTDGWFLGKSQNLSSVNGIVHKEYG